jgi:branched-chain amino acid aminotransferase
MPAVVMEEFDRAAPRGTGGYKVGGNYAPCMRWQGKARQQGFGLTLHLDAQTRTEVEEFSTSGFIGVRREADGKTTLCIPDSKNIVQSVTSDSIIKIAESLGWNVEKRRVRLIISFLLLSID